MASRVQQWHDATRVLARAASDTNVGSAQKSTPSASQLLTTLIPVLLVAAIWFVLFLALRNLYPRIYRPRTFLSSLRPQERAPDLPKGFINWFGAFFNISDTKVLNTQSMDGFLFLRLLKITVITCFVGCCITWPVLFPVNATGPGKQSQLNIITMSNAASGSNKTSYYRYFAHTGCAYLFFGFVIYMITRESLYYINLRQAYLISPLYADRVSSKTVLFTAVPEAYLDEALLREMLGPGVVNVWIPRDTQAIEDQVKERDKIVMKLEGAETKLIKTANMARLKALKDQTSHREEESAEGEATRYVDPKERPTHRLKPLIGKKVDTIEWCRAELQKRIPEVEKLQQAHRGGEGKLLSSVFVQFETLRLAQAAFQSVTHHQPLHMAPRYTGISPADVIWSNLKIKWWERVIRGLATTTAVVALIIFWSIPVAAIGAISNINALTTTKGLTWLGFINHIPNPIKGIVSGLLPVVLMALLFTLLPIFLRLMAKVGGEATLAGVEYTVQNSYFAFQVIQVFLVATLASGAATAGAQIAKNPSSAVSLLANSLPTASNFYLSYFILQGLGIASSTLVAIAGLIIFMVLGKILDKTPRKMYNRWTNLSAPGLGTVYPIYTNLFVIALAYSCIAPLVLGFAFVGLWLFYFAYRYQFLFVYGSSKDTLGLMYPRALQQMFVGLYLAELCLIGLFAIGTGESRGALGPLILMVLFLVFTALWHMSLNSAIDPLLKFLPKTLETEERRLLALEDVEDDAEIGGHSTQHENESKRNGEKVAEDKNGNQNKPVSPAQSSQKKPNFIQKFMRPDKHTDYHTMRKLVPRQFASVDYDADTQAEAYLHPSILAQPPIVWIPHDEAGVSSHEIRETPNEISITDQGATFDEKGKIVWDHENASSVPIYQEKIYY